MLASWFVNLATPSVSYPSDLHPFKRTFRQSEEWDISLRALLLSTSLCSRQAQSGCSIHLQHTPAAYISRFSDHETIVPRKKSPSNIINHYSESSKSTTSTDRVIGHRTQCKFHIPLRVHHHQLTHSLSNSASFPLPPFPTNTQPPHPKTNSPPKNTILHQRTPAS